MQRTVPLELKETVPMAVDGRPVSASFATELEVVVNVETGTEEEFSIEIVKLVWVLTTSVTELVEVEFA